MNTATLSSKRQAELITRYMDQKNVDNFPNLPVVESLRSALAKRCMAILHMNRGAKKIAVKRTVKADDKTLVDNMPISEFWANVNFAFDTLWKLGYTQDILPVVKGTIIWRRIRRDPIATLGYALLKFSQKLETTQDYRIMFIFPPIDENTGLAKYTDSYFPSVYMSKDIWTFAQSGGSPYVKKTLDFNPWDAPFQTYLQDGILLEREQNPDH